MDKKLEYCMKKIKLKKLRGKLMVRILKIINNEIVQTMRRGSFFNFHQLENFLDLFFLLKLLNNLKDYSYHH